MTTMAVKRCATDDDLAKFSLFFLTNRRDIHPSYSTMDTIEMLYSYSTHGHLVQVVDGDDRIIGASAYYYGDPDNDFEDKHIAYIDMAVAERAYRGTRLFAAGLKFLVGEIAGNPDVREVRFKAAADNEYLCNLYAKFTETSYEMDSPIGKLTMFCVKINSLRALLAKFKKV